MIIFVASIIHFLIISIILYRFFVIDKNTKKRVRWAVMLYAAAELCYYGLPPVVFAPLTTKEAYDLLYLFREGALAFLLAVTSLGWKNGAPKDLCRRAKKCKMN